MLDGKNTTQKKSRVGRECSMQGEEHRKRDGKQIIPSDLAEMNFKN